MMNLKEKTEAIAPPLFEIQDLELRYGRRLAFEAVSLRLNSQKVSALIGPSGCGKTSFLYCLNRLSDMIPGCSVKGTVQFRGQDTRDFEVLDLRRRVGLIFQKPNPFPSPCAETSNCRCGNTG